MTVMSLMFFCRSSNPASMMPRWVATSPGFPRGLPGENFMDRILGGRASLMRSLLNVVQTVLIPAPSTPRAISPTD